MTARHRLAVRLLLAVAMGVFANPGGAEPLSAQTLQEIEQLRTAQGRSADEIKPLLDHVKQAEGRGLPAESLANKLKEGLAKGVDPRRIDPVLRQMTGHLETAQETLRDASARGIVEPGGGPRQQAIETLAEALQRGVTIEEIRELGRSGSGGRQRLDADALAVGAKSLAVVKEGQVLSKDGTALVAEGLRQGYRSRDLGDLARELKRRGRDVQEGRIRLDQIRERISRGERPDRLFRDDRGDGGEGRGERRDRGDRGDRGGGRERDRGDRLDHVDRDERGGRHGGRDAR